MLSPHVRVWLIYYISVFFIISTNIGVLSVTLLSNEEDIKAVMLLMEAFVGQFS